MDKIALLINRVGMLLLITSTLSGCYNTTKGPKSQTSQRVYFSHSMPTLSLPGASKTDMSAAPEARARAKADSISVPEIVLYFDNDSAVIRDADLERIQSFVLSHTVDDQTLFIITGHTDSNNSDEYNMRLSERRAKSAQGVMQTMGISPTQTAIRFLGEISPVSTNSTDTGRQENRRVTVTAIY